MTRPIEDCPDADRLAGYDDGRLAGPERRALARHLRTCRSCRALCPGPRRRFAAGAFLVLATALGAGAALLLRAEARPGSLGALAGELARLPAGRPVPAELLDTCERLLAGAYTGPPAPPIVLRAAARPVRLVSPVGPIPDRRPALVARLPGPAEAEILRIDVPSGALRSLGTIPLPAGDPATVAWPASWPDLDPGRYQIVVRGSGLLAGSWGFAVVASAPRVTATGDHAAARLARALQLLEQGFAGPARACVLEADLPDGLRARIDAACEEALRAWALGELR